MGAQSHLFVQQSWDGDTPSPGSAPKNVFSSPVGFLFLMPTCHFSPDDHSRVHLTPVEGVPDSDYINASFINVSGCFPPKQGPATCVAFMGCDFCLGENPRGQGRTCSSDGSTGQGAGTRKLGLELCHCSAPSLHTSLSSPFCNNAKLLGVLRSPSRPLWEGFGSRSQ